MSEAPNFRWLVQSSFILCVDWTTFRLVPEDEREAMINEFKTFINDKASAREQKSRLCAI